MLLIPVTALAFKKKPTTTPAGQAADAAAKRKAEQDALATRLAADKRADDERRADLAKKGKEKEEEKPGPSGADPVLDLFAETTGLLREVIAAGSQSTNPAYREATENLVAAAR